MACNERKKYKFSFDLWCARAISWLFFLIIKSYLFVSGILFCGMASSIYPYGDYVETGLSELSRGESFYYFVAVIMLWRLYSYSKKFNVSFFKQLFFVIRKSGIIATGLMVVIAVELMAEKMGYPIEQVEDALNFNGFAMLSVLFCLYSSVPDSSNVTSCLKQTVPTSQKNFVPDLETSENVILSKEQGNETGKSNEVQ
ncbi:hypothetical protein [Halodesulfovibrio sp.]|jgi:hypothetical protein|uniref:hypothetical protein n=1 Tax=Halodesulfovibrio sp. TaxID=1912772 RepID=UPI0025E965C7|nr:hypothetical protein [Halodesulfovibrio sp.]MCT4625472.1 hypothetical protein [Halodesulfovibrio sp.]